MAYRWSNPSLLQKMEISKDLLVSHFGCCLILGVSTCILLLSSFFLESSTIMPLLQCHCSSLGVLRSGWTSRGFSLTSKKEAVTYGSSFYAANPKRKRRTPRPSRSRPPKVITRLMMALWKNAHALEVCMISQRQAGFDRNPAKLKDRGQNVVCICGERAKRLLDRWRTI